MAQYKGAASEAGRAMQLMKKREKQREQLQQLKMKIAEDNLVKSNIDKKFSTHYDAVEAELKSSTVGLVTLNDMKAKQEALVKEREKQLAKKEQSKELLLKLEKQKERERKKEEKRKIASLSFTLDEDKRRAEGGGEEEEGEDEELEEELRSEDEDLIIDRFTQSATIGTAKDKEVNGVRLYGDRGSLAPGQALGVSDCVLCHRGTAEPYFEGFGPTEFADQRTGGRFTGGNGPITTSGPTTTPPRDGVRHLSEVKRGVGEKPGRGHQIPAGSGPE
ncbi:LOW QUALITY PROTEIN: protein FAM50A-like, partial [Leucoraja erinacea]|uniref:LOW QUALITY PROTEIN: protein FAM50A-like n=1 Tax=Leucoraja erinaceus TaxID=7782 RepID=UPI0024562A37